MRKVLLGLLVLLILGTGAYLRFRHPKAPMEVGYAGDRQVIVWSTSAQVREVVTTVSFGEKLDVLQRFQDQVKVRTAKGITGWIAERELLSADVWEKAKDLDKRAAGMPIEARGHTKVLSNLHIEPGRDSLRLRQLNKNTPLDVLARQPVAAATVRGAGAGEDPATALPGKKEDGGLDDGAIYRSRRSRSTAGLRQFGGNAYRRVVRVKSRCGCIPEGKAAISSSGNARSRRATVRFFTATRVHMGPEEGTIRNGVCGKRLVRETAR